MIEFIQSEQQSNWKYKWAAPQGSWDQQKHSFFSALDISEGGRESVSKCSPRNNGSASLKFGIRYKLTGLRDWVNLKHDNPKKYKPDCIAIKFMKIYNKQVLKAAREK